MNKQEGDELDEKGWCSPAVDIVGGRGSDTAVRGQGLWQTCSIHALMNVLEVICGDFVYKNVEGGEQKFAFDCAVSKASVESWALRTEQGELLSKACISLPDLLGILEVQFENGRYCLARTTSGQIKDLHCSFKFQFR